MKLNNNKFAIAVAEVMGAWYIICALLVVVVPEIAATLFSWMVHLVNVQAGVGFPEVIYGFIEVVILTYISAYIFASLHNRAVEK